MHLRNGSSGYITIHSVSPKLFYCFQSSCKLLHRNVESLVIKSTGLCKLAYSPTVRRSKVQKFYIIIWDWIFKLFILKINADYIRILRAIGAQCIQELTFSPWQHTFPRNLISSIYKQRNGRASFSQMMLVSSSVNNSFFHFISVLNSVRCSGI